MKAQPTCGKGLAANSGLSAKLGDLTAAMAQILEVHMKALDLSDSNARAEHQAYQKLGQAHRAAAAQLRSLAAEMVGYRDLPMGKHDPRAMSGPEPALAFERFIQVEEELLDLLQNRLAQDRGLLLQMGRAGQGAS
jgi:hypothetical protein